MTWMKAGTAELDNLKERGTAAATYPDRKEDRRREAKASGQQFVELPSKGAFTNKPDKYIDKIVACGDKPLTPTAAFPLRILTLLRLAVFLKGRIFS